MVSTLMSTMIQSTRVKVFISNDRTEDDAHRNPAKADLKTQHDSQILLETGGNAGATNDQRIQLAGDDLGKDASADQKLINFDNVN